MKFRSTVDGLVTFLCLSYVLCATSGDWQFRGPNIAKGKTATQRPGDFEDVHTYPAGLAVDGDETSDFSKKSCTHTNGSVFFNNNYQKYMAQWLVELGGDFNVTGIVIVNRDKVKSRLKGFFVAGYNTQYCLQGTGHWCTIYDDNGTESYSQKKIWINVHQHQIIAFSKIAINLPGDTNQNTYLTLCEVQIFAAPLPSCYHEEKLENGHNFIFNNTGVDVHGQYTAGTIIQADCYQKFLLKGSEFVKCLPNGKFNSSVPSCVGACYGFPIQHGFLSRNQSLYEVHSNDSVVCNSDYEPDKSVITCQLTGFWSSIATCNIIQCHHPGNPENGYYIRNDSKSDAVLEPSQPLQIGSTIYVVCNKGFENNKTEVRLCQSSKDWSGQSPVCMKKQCPYPMPISNGEFRFTNYIEYKSGSLYYNTSIFVVCKKGYNLSGHLKHVCGDMKKWEGNSSCEIVKCDYPEIPNKTVSVMKESNGMLTPYTSGQSRYLDKIIVTCRIGYVLMSSSSKSRYCLETKLWSGEPSQCVLVTCKELEELKGGTYNYTNISSSGGYPYQTEVTAYCHKPFRLLDPQTRSRRCNENGEWDSVPSVCIETKAAAAVQSTYAGLIGGVSAAAVVIISIVIVVCFLLYRRRQIEGHETGKPKRYAYLWKKDNNNEHISNSQDDVYSEIQEESLNSINENRSSNTGPTSDGTYSYVMKKTTNKNTMKSSNQSSDSLQPEPYYSFTNVNNVPKTAILVKDLSDLILTGFDAKGKFEKEFNELPQGMIQPHKEALKKKNIIKNRYRNLYAYDDTRVVLKTDEASQSDYINACYVHGFTAFKQYIASQGPTKEILLDFWRMIWQEESSRIVMLTNLMEEGKEKCEQYWPEEGTSHVFGNIIVRTEKIDNFSQFVKRTFQVKKEGSKQKSRTVTQYHFTAWPDKGVPKYASSLVQFTNKVKYDSVEQNGPIVVHCSAGVGRTGTFIALDFLTDQGKAMGYIDVLGTITAFRSQRVCLVQTLDQYIFVHHALVESLMLPTSALPAYKFPEAFEELLQMDTKKKKSKLVLEFETLKKVSPVADEGDYVSSKLVRNRRKNRYSNVLPVEEFMPSLLSTHSDSDNRYINAVFLPSYKERKAFIITQTPLETTKEDFWDLIWEHDVHTIVMMNNLKETVDSEKYWPEKGESVTFGNIEITEDGVEKKNHHQLVTLSAKKHKVTRKIKQIRCGGWSYNHSLPASPDVILTLLEIVKVWQRQSGHHTIVVHCMNGVDKSGLYCVISAVIERLQIEQDVAISQVIEEMRSAREQVIPSVEQYKFCHEAVLEFIHQFDTYSNFTE